MDFFRRPDGRYGYEECWRDPEDGRGWSVVGHHGARVFATDMAALAAAHETVAWLVEVD